MVEIAKGIAPSSRGELEITAVNNVYLQKGQLQVVILDRDVAWFDTGTAESLCDVAVAVKAMQQETGRQIACPEEIAYRRRYLSREALAHTADGLSMTPYGQYLLALSQEQEEPQ